MKPKKPIAEIIIGSMGKKPKMPMEDAMSEGGEGIEIAQDVISAVKAGDAKLLSEALEAAFMHFDSKPHVEGEHEEEEME